MKILVVGSRGQVGSELVRLGEERSHQIIALDRSKLDVTSKEEVEQSIKQNDPDIVINATAYTAVDKAENDTETAYLVNEKAAGYLAEACDRGGIPLLHISTDFVFNGEKSEPYLETDPCDPLGVYGASKLAGEKAVISRNGKYIILRTAWVFGGTNNFVNTMKRLAADRDVISVVADQKGGPTPASSIAEALLSIAEQCCSKNFEDWGIYHFTGAASVSWYEFADYILRNDETTEVRPIATSEYPTPAKRPSNSVLDCGKIKKVFGISQPNWKSFIE